MINSLNSIQYKIPIGKIVCASVYIYSKWICFQQLHEDQSALDVSFFPWKEVFLWKKTFQFIFQELDFGKLQCLYGNGNTTYTLNYIIHIVHTYKIYTFLIKDFITNFSSSKYITFINYKQFTWKEHLL